MAGTIRAGLALVDVLKTLDIDYSKARSEAYDNPGIDGFDHEKTAAYSHHPLVYFSEWLESNIGINRWDLRDAAYRLNTPNGLKEMPAIPSPSGMSKDGLPDLLWMVPKFRELDQDGTTARLVQMLLDKFPKHRAVAEFVSQKSMGEPTVDSTATLVKWQMAASYLESERIAGKAFKTQAAYAKLLGCVVATINKAIARTVSLQEWSKRPMSVSSAAQQLDDIQLDKAVQSRERDPADIMEAEDVDTAMNYLIDNAKPEERARIQAMQPDERRRLATVAYQSHCEEIAECEQAKIATYSR